jgi:hypothetical protein
MSGQQVGRDRQSRATNPISNKNLGRLDPDQFDSNATAFYFMRKQAVG